jgi:hypothetical protein
MVVTKKPLQGRKRTALLNGGDRQGVPEDVQRDFTSDVCAVSYRKRQEVWYEDAERAILLPSPFVEVNLVFAPIRVLPLQFATPLNEFEHSLWRERNLVDACAKRGQGVSYGIGNGRGRSNSAAFTHTLDAARRQVVQTGRTGCGTLTATRKMRSHLNHQQGRPQQPQIAVC